MKESGPKVGRPHRLHGEPAEFEHRLVGVTGSPIRLQDHDRLRYGVGDLSKLRFLFPQSILGALSVLNVGVRSVPVHDITVLIAQRLSSEQEPPIFSVVSPQASFNLPGLSGCDEFQPLIQNLFQIIRMNCDLPPPAMGLVRPKTRVVVPSLVEEFIGAVRQAAPRERWYGINDSSQLGWRFERRFRCTHRFSFGPATETLRSRYSQKCQLAKSNIEESMGGNICRCGTYVRIREAIKGASGQPK